MDTTYKYERQRKHRFFLFPFLVIIGLFALSGLVMVLWNYVFSSFLHIDYWQAMALFVLSKILFGGFRFGKHRKAHQHFSNAGFDKKFMEMSDEERQQFKNQFKNRCC